MPCVENIIGYNIHARSLDALITLHRSIPCEHKGCATSCRNSCLHIDATIADNERISKIDIVFACRLKKHACLRFAAVAHFFIRW